MTNGPLARIVSSARVRFLIGIALASLGTAASAAVLGGLKTGSAGTMTVTLSSIAFNPDPSAVPLGPLSNSDVTTGTSLTFTGGPLAVSEAVLVSSPVTSSTVLPVTSYLQFGLHPNLVYSLASIGPGSSNTNCATATSIGDSCSPFAGSPLVFTKSPAGTTIGFAVAGRTSDTGVLGLPSGSTYQGGFVGPLAGMSPAQAQLFFCPSGTCVAADFASGRSITTSQSGAFSTVLVSGVDLTITKTDGVTTVVPGTTTTYTITVSNKGTVGVSGAAVTDTFPPEVTSATWTCTAAGGASCTASGSGDIADTVDLPSATSVTYTVQAAIDPSATGSVSNTATVAAPNGVTDVNTGNNSATDTDTLTPEADLQVVKTGPSAVQPGVGIVYIVSVTNNGPSDAQNVDLADTLPAGTTFVAQTKLTGPAFTLGATTTSIDDTIGTLAAGASASFRITIATGGISVGTTLSNTATVSASTTDQAPSNNSSTATTTISAQVPLLSPIGALALAFALLGAGLFALRRG